MTPGQVLLHYRLVEQIGEGGMGVVWKAVDTTLDREVAIKILPQALAGDAERLARFEREAKVLASLNHPNVATVHGFHDADGVRFLVMELVPGETLEQRLKLGAMPPDEAIPVARKIVDGIEYAHERGIVHRDLKPANIKLTGDGGVKVLDFGLAKAIAGDPMSSGPTSTPTVIPTLTSMGTVAGMILGTAAYMSPEQARGTNIDRRADVWAFGAVFYEMLTAKRAFDGETVSDTLASVLRAPVEWDQLPAGTPPSVVRLLKRCLERDVKKRLRDIGEARIALDSLGQGDEAQPQVVAAVAPKRSLAPWILFAVALLAALGLGARGWMQPPPAKPAVTRFEVTTDAKLARMDWPRLSPDGRILAFQGTDKAGKTSIWLRPLESKAAYLLAGTEGVNSRPFWSPDSKYLAYFEGSQLKKIPVAGGPTQTIGDTEFGADGTWGTNGIILFDGRNAADSIRQVAATGGKPTFVFDEEARKTVPNNAWPFFLPDGKHFIFTSNKGGSSIANISICLGAVGSQETKLLTPTDSRAEYANGYLIYVLKGTLIAHRFDPDQLKLIGDPIPLADHVNANNTRAAYSVSENGMLAYLESASTSDSSQLVWMDRTGKELGKEGEPGLYSDVALSPDGKWLAYCVRETADGNRDVWVRDLQRHTSSRFTFNPADDFRPTWSPDGTKIYFASNRGDELFRCYSKPANGIGNETVVVQDPKFHFVPSSFSADGRLLVLDRFGQGAVSAVVVTSADGSGERTVLAAENPQSSGRFSPDGRFLAYMSNETRTAEVYIQSWPPGAGKWQVSQGGGGQIRWRLDGKELFYRTLDFDYFAVPVTLDSQFSLGLPTPMFRRRVVTGGTQGTMGWSIAPDGQKFLLNATVGDAAAPNFTMILNWPETLRAR